MSFNSLNPYSEIDISLMPQTQNVVATLDVGCKLDLKEIVTRSRNSEYNPRKFAAVVMRIREPKCTALMFQSGKMVVTGAKSPAFAKTAARKFARILQKLDFNAQFRDFKVQNMVATTDVNFPIRLEGMAQVYSKKSSYEPELFPGLIYRLSGIRDANKVVILIFVSGKVVFTGAKSKQEIEQAFQEIHPILVRFRKDSYFEEDEEDDEDEEDEDEDEEDEDQERGHNNENDFHSVMNDSFASEETANHNNNNNQRATLINNYDMNMIPENTAEDIDVDPFDH